MAQIAKILVFVGMLLILSGGILWLFGDKMNWLGQLPGDVRIKTKNVRIYFPWVTMLLLSVLFSLFMWLIRRFF